MGNKPHQYRLDRRRTALRSLGCTATRLRLWLNRPELRHIVGSLIILFGLWSLWAIWLNPTIHHPH